MKVGKSNIKLIQEKLKYYFLLIIISFSCSCAPNVSIESHRLSLEDELKKLRTQNNKSEFKLHFTNGQGTFGKS